MIRRWVCISQLHRSRECFQDNGRMRLKGIQKSSGLPLPCRPTVPGPWGRQSAFKGWDLLSSSGVQDIPHHHCPPPSISELGPLQRAKAWLPPPRFQSTGLPGIVGGSEAHHERAVGMEPQPRRATGIGPQQTSAKGHPAAETWG